MCLIVDTNTWGVVIGNRSVEFAPIYKYICNGGWVVCGGSHYKREFLRVQRLIMEFSKTRRINLKQLNDAQVDSKESEIQKSYSHNKLDDTHIIAISLVGGTRLVCSSDRASYKFLKLLPVKYKAKRIRIYNSSKNANLLYPYKLRELCRDCRKSHAQIR